MLKKPLLYLLLLLGIVLASCSDYQKLLKSTDNELKYEKAIAYYEDGDYYRAMQLFEQLNMVYRGTNKAEKLTYYMAYCYYNQEEYIMASYYFKRYAKSFPTTDRAEECLYMSAYCQYLLSPIYSLDQSNTFEAIKELQLFINKYPDSDRVAKANDLIDDLRAKLEKKAFEVAELYFKMEDYEAAITSFENLLKQFPDTEYKEKVLYYTMKSYFEYAMNSIEKKKPERLALAIESFENFIFTYPETDYLKEARNIQKETQKELNKYEN